jgi:hypothetical protein
MATSFEKFLHNQIYGSKKILGSRNTKNLKLRKTQIIYFSALDNVSGMYATTWQGDREMTGLGLYETEICKK